MLITPHGQQRVDGTHAHVQAESNAQNLQVVKSFASSFESFQVSVVPEVSHFIMMEEPETFNRLLTQDVNQLKSAP